MSETDGLLTDGFRFSVSDTDRNRLDNQMFTITITPVRNPPPVLAFADLITVNGSQSTGQCVLCREEICSVLNTGFLPESAATFFLQSV